MIETITKVVYRYNGTDYATAEEAQHELLMDSLYEKALEHDYHGGSVLHREIKELFSDSGRSAAQAKVAMALKDIIEHWEIRHKK